MVSKTHLPSLLSKHISNNLSVHLFLDFEWQLGKTKEFNTQGLQKVQISSAFKIYSFSVANKNQKADRLCMNFQCKCAAGDSTPYFKINAPLFLYPLNFKEYLNPQIRINKMENKFRLLPQSFRINLKYRFSHPLLRPVRAFSLARSFVEFFLKSVYPSMVGKLFK